MNNLLSCYLVGEGSLLIQCATQLIEQGYTIYGVVSSDKGVIQWLKNQPIDHCLPTDDVISFLKNHPSNYLFSIANTALLPKEIIEIPNRYAINYHDALLPQYAGLYATSWAIIQQEKQHGVTWHVMAEKVDSGEILKQATVEIHAGETAFTLNGKCYEAAITSFAELIHELATNTVVPVPQDLRKRSYFSRSQQSSQGCLITWQSDAFAIDALVRSLDFGPYPNPLGVAKFFIGDEAIVVTETKVTEVTSTLPPGTIVMTAPDALCVATASYDIELHQLLTVTGKALTIEALVKRFGLHDGYQLKNIDSEHRQYVTELDAKLGRHETFWLNQLVAPEPLVIPYIKPSNNPTETFQVRAVATPDAVSSFVNAHFPERQASDFVLAAFIAYLFRVGENDTFDIGLRCADKGFSNVFASHIPCRIRLDKAQCFADIFDVINTQINEAARHKTYLQDMRIRYPDLARQAAHPLPIIVEKTEHIEAVAFAPAFALNVVIQDDGKAYQFLYNPAALSEEAAIRMTEQFAVFMRSIIAQPAQPIAKLSLLPEAEYQKIILDWNQTEHDYPKHACLHQLFEIQAEKTPDSIAVIYADQHITYRELNTKANQLAHHLQSLGVEAEMLVGLCLERSLDMVIGLLGILKAGGAYLPVDPTYPNARIAFMLEDSSVQVLVTQQKLVDKLAEMQGAQLVCMDADWSTIAQSSTANPAPAAHSENLMYVIYTSGSTGKPKGVQIIHRALVNFLYAMRQSVGLDPQDKLLAVTTLSFDIATLELYLPLITGAQVILASREMALDALQLLDKIKTSGATVMQATPATWQLLLNVGWQKTENFKILCGGEALPRLMAEQLLQRGDSVWNLYGPTETTVWSTVYQVQAQVGEDKTAAELIGRPLINTQLYILDEDLQPTPIGVHGQLYIGGDGLARGYLNRPELTSERFIPNPFSQHADSRLYLTGDLVRYRLDGNIEYISRIDHQVKIRGYRIEIGEIESRLRQHEAVSEAVVVAQDFPPGSKNLIAYVVLKSTQTETSSEQLLTHLRQTLPDYMVPVLLITLDAMPLTPNGKVDRRSLPLPEAKDTAQFQQQKAQISADMPVEQALTLMWSSLLRREHIGLHEKFFEIGGDSLLATELILQIRDTLGIQLPVSKLFEFSTISKLSHVIENMQAQAGVAQVNKPTQQDKEASTSQSDAELLAVLEELAASDLDIDAAAKQLDSLLK